MPHLTLVRGLPGSGKSTFAQTLQDGSMIHVEADQYFILGDGEYKFDPNLLRPAHEWCLSSTIRWLRLGYSVVVSNPFVQLWEMERYFAIPSLLLNTTLSVVEMRTQYESPHNIPEVSIEKMRARFQPLPVDFAFPLTIVMPTPSTSSPSTSLPSN